VTAREARVHAVLLAVLTWLVSAITTIGGSDRTSLVGVFNAPDFVQFYTLGRMAREHRILDAYDWEKFHAEQVSLIPESVRLLYPPVYPPQAAALFIPFATMSFESAVGLWTAITVLGYGVIVWRAWLAVRGSLPDPILVFAAAAGFPPFWSAVMNGQITFIILMSCFLGWIALEHGHRFWAGVALGALGIKPQFAPVFVVIVLARRDWRMMMGAITSLALQGLVVWFVLGLDAFRAYAEVLPTISAHADDLEAKPFHSHSIRSLTRLLPEFLGVPIWIATVGLVLWKTVRAWTSAVPLTVRFGLVLLAAVLINPHLIMYDATLLVLPLMWFGAWLNQQPIRHAGQDRSLLTVDRYGAFLYVLVLAFFAPSAAVIRIQISVLLMLWLFWKVQGLAIEPTPRRSAG
jgi:hypothetical protein